MEMFCKEKQSEKLNVKTWIESFSDTQQSLPCQLIFTLSTYLYLVNLSLPYQLIFTLSTYLSFSSLWPGHYGQQPPPRHRADRAVSQPRALPHPLRQLLHLAPLHDAPGGRPDLRLPCRVGEVRAEGPKLT